MSRYPTVSSFNARSPAPSKYNEDTFAYYEEYRPVEYRPPPNRYDYNDYLAPSEKYFYEPLPPVKYEMPIIDYGPPPIPRKVRYDDMPYVPSGPGLVSDIEFLYF